MVGLTSKNSFMLWDEVHKHEVLVLIDCGATHNLMSTKLVAAKNLQVEDTPPYRVEDGNGHGM